MSAKGKEFFHAAKITYYKVAGAKSLTSADKQ